jgi:hypothetical protein
MKAATMALTVAILGTLPLGARARVDEAKVPLKDVPQAVLHAVKAKFPGAELKEASKETEDGKTTYEIALKDKGQNVDVAVSAAGEIEEIEREVAPKDLPKPVVATVEAKYPKATIKKAEEIIEFDDGLEKKNFELLIETADKKTRELKVSPMGRLLEDEEADEDEDD